MPGIASNLLIPFGLRDGRMWRPTEVDRGLGCRCACPGCGIALVARNSGERRQPYFAHYSSGICLAGFESAIHLMAKQVLLGANQILLPEWNGTPQMPNPPTVEDGLGRRRLGRYVFRASRQATVHNAAPEKTLGGIRPDVIAYDETGQLLIEVRVSHRVDQRKREAVQAKRYRMLEVDLSSLTVDDVSNAQRFDELVLADPSNRHWISLPEAEDEWRDAFSELQQEVAQEKLVDAGTQSPQQLPKSVILAAPATPAEVLMSASPGSRLWHSGLGNGTVTTRLVGPTPIFQVNFDGVGQRTIVLEESGAGTKWRLL
jgi:hypothetical protein